MKSCFVNVSWSSRLRGVAAVLDSWRNSWDEFFHVCWRTFTTSAWSFGQVQPALCWVSQWPTRTALYLFQRGCSWCCEGGSRGFGVLLWCQRLVWLNGHEVRQLYPPGSFSRLFPGCCCWLETVRNALVEPSSSAPGWRQTFVSVHQSEVCVCLLRQSALRNTRFYLKPGGETCVQSANKWAWMKPEL